MPQDLYFLQKKEYVCLFAQALQFPNLSAYNCSADN